MIPRTTLASLVIALVVGPGCTSGAPPSASGVARAPAVASSPRLSVAETRVAPVRAVPRVTLTAADGTGLRLARLSAKAVVDEPLALTELAMTFENPQGRVLEGTFRFTLPSGASVSRFAMRVGEVWQEGEVVERQSARRAYEDFLHKKQDPALLEQAAGSEFSARVFPIPPHGTKEIVIAYSEEIEPRRGYDLPLRGLPELGELEVVIARAGAKEPEVSIHRRSFVPDDVGLLPRRSSYDGLASDGLALVRVRPEILAAPEPIGSAVLLFDTSASRALGLTDQLGLLTRVVHGMDAQARLVVACFDQGVEEVFDGEAGAFGAREIARIQARGALGASDLDRALAWAGGVAGHRGATRAVVISDGVATAGDVSDEALVARARSLGALGVTRLDAVAVGGIQDDAALRRIVTAGLPHDGVVADGTLDEPSLARRLSQATRSKIAVSVPGATWSWPKTLDGVQPGDERTIYVELPKEQRALQVVVGGKRTTPELRAAPRPLLERSWAQAKIASLVDERAAGGEGGKDVTKEIVDLSIAHRVVSPYTAMIVLETAADYARFHIDRRAVADILTVDHGDIAIARRTPEAEAPGVGATAAPAPRDVTKAVASESAELRWMDAPRERGDLPPAGEPVTGNLWAGDVSASTGGGGLGLQGVGEGGGGNAEGIGLASISTVGHGRGVGSGQGFGAGHVSGTTVRMGAASVSGMGGGSGVVAALVPAAKPAIASPYEGRFAQVMDAIGGHDLAAARTVASAWHEQDPGDVLGLVALGETLEAGGDLDRAARAYGSIIDLFPARADMRRYAGERLERLEAGAGVDLAIDTFTKANEERPDHPSSHRLLAFALLKKGLYDKAFDAALGGLTQRYPAGRFAGVDGVLREDLGLIAAAWAKTEPAKAAGIRARLKELGGVIEDAPSLRFVLTWETDANDVDLHVHDGQGAHAFFSQPTLPSGGRLYADVTTGYGPECFTVRAPTSRRAGPYRLQANYYARGPMGYGMGKLEIIDHDGAGGLTFEERPFVVMTDHAFVELGTAR